MMLSPVGAAASGPGFNHFYSLYLARSAGARVRSTVLRDLYLDYAASTGAPLLGFKEIGRQMKARGHRAQRSNQVQYCDVMIVRQVEAVRFDPAMLTANRIVACLSAAIDDLEATRARLIRDLGAAAGLENAL